MIKALLFDYGVVITTGGGGNELSERLGDALGISSDHAFELLSPVWSTYAKGKISEDELWRSIEIGYGKPIHISKRAIWNTYKQHMKPQPEMIDLITRLQRDGYTVGLLSNVIPNTAEDIRKNGGYDIFDFLILSCEVGYAKPEEQIYRIALERLKSINPGEVVFIDDQERMLNPARDLGMKTIHAKNPVQIGLDIQSLLKN